jgi:hypothetical protein
VLLQALASCSRAFLWPFVIEQRYGAAKNHQLSEGKAVILGFCGQMPKTLPSEIMGPDRS